MAPSQTATLRRTRERDLVHATRALFDERGMQDAPIEEIAKAVGIARGLIYRQFSSKDELFVLTVTDYLDELDAVLAAAVDPRPTTRSPSSSAGRAPTPASASATRRSWTARCRSCAARRATSATSCPSRSGCASGRAWRGASTTSRGCCGRRVGTFASRTPTTWPTSCGPQTLGMMHLARIRVGVRQVAPGIPGLFAIEPERVIETVVAHARAIVGPAA